MANNDTVFSGILDALNSNRRKKNTIDPTSPNFQPTQSMPNTSGKGGPELQQQQFLDWQVTKIAHDLYTRTVYYDTDRIGAYQDFRAMDGSPEIAAALNIIRDECLTRGEKGNILEVYSENERVKDVLKDLFHNVLNVEFNLRLWIRDLVKYGDYFVLLQVDREVGIYDFMTLPMEEVHREEGYDGRIDSVRFRWETTGDYFEEWQVAHFRLLEDSRKLPYGRSLLDSSRKLWKQLQLAEDAMLVYRITRAPERRVFYVEVGNLPDPDVKTYMGKVQNQIRKQPLVNQHNGNVSQKYDPENVTEDFWIPIRGDKSSRIETLPGAANLGDIQDIEYLQNKLFAALQVPKAYLNYSDGLQGGSTLSQADLRFSRTINSIQMAITLELRRVANIHLYFVGLQDEIDNFSLALTNPSTQQELLKLETMKSRLDVFKEFFSSEVTSPASYTWAMENILGFSKNDIKLILKQKKVEKKIFAEIESAVETYKKIGLFDELDERYEDPEAVAAMAAQGTGGDNGGGDDGGGDFGGSGGGSFGGDFGGSADGLEGGEFDDAGGDDAGGAEDGGEEALSESRIMKKAEKRLNQELVLSERRIDKFLNELLGDDKNAAEVLKEKREETKGALLKKGSNISSTARKLLESMDKSLNSINLKDDEDKTEKEMTVPKFDDKIMETIFETLDELIDPTNESTSE